MQVLVRGGDQAGVIGFGHRAALAFTPAVDADPVEQAAPAAGLEAHQPGHRYPPGALAGHRGPPGCSRGGPRSGPSAGAGSARPRPQSRSTPRSPPLASYLRPGHGPPRGDRVLVALRGPVHRDLRGEPDPVQQIGGAPQRVPHVEQPADQRGDPGQCPPLVLTPAPGRRAALQRRPQPLQLRWHSAGTPPRPALSRPARPRRRPASAAATHTPS